jgi:hypothetical protein
MYPASKAHFINYLLTDLNTGETSQLLLSKETSPYTVKTPIEVLAQQLKDNCDVLCNDEETLGLIYVYARLLFC